MMAVERGMSSSLGRRSFLLLAGTGALGVLSGCRGNPEPAPASRSATGAPGVIVSGLSTPWSMVRRADGSILVSERETGLLKALMPGGTLETFAEVPGVVPDGEGGLLGLEILERDGTEWLYAYITARTENRVLRFELTATGLGAATTIIDGIPKASIHNGGRLKVGPDKLLYIGTGDATDKPAAQNLSRLNGKILRLKLDGSIPPGNPFDGSPVYSMGHRNVQGLAWDSTLRLWSTELGPDRNDELNLIVPGGNYGWPEVTGAPHREDFLDAVHVWGSTSEASPSALTIVGGAAYVACLRGECLWRLELPSGEPISRGTLPGAEVVLTGQGRLRDIMAVSDSELWVATNEGASSRIISLAVAAPAAS